MGLLALVFAGWLLWAPPRATVDRAALEFGEQRVGMRSESLTLRLGNRGRRALRVAAVEPVGEAADEFAVAADGCTGRVLPRGATCTIGVTFSPAEPRGRRAELVLSGNDTTRVALTGTGTAPRLAAEPERLDFGRQAVGQTSGAREVTLTNGGSAPLTLVRVAPTGPAAAVFRRASDECSGSSLPPGASCAASWTFRPARVGEVTAALLIESDDGGSPAIALNGVGVAPGLLMTPERLDFGALGVGRESPPSSVLLENTGNAPLALTGLELAGSDRAAYEIVEQDCETTLEPGDNCSAAVRFSPISEGAAAASLQPRAAGLARRPEVALAGRGTSRRLAARPQRLEFGRVEAGEEARQSVLLESVGGERVTLRRIAVAGGAATEFRVGGSCRAETVLADGRSCTVEVHFAPQAVGARDAALRIEHDGVGGSLAVELAGGGFAAPVTSLEVRPERLDFGAWRVGERSGIESVRLASTGTARLGLEEIVVAGAHAADFQLVPASCTGIPYVAPGSDCVVGLRFGPSRPGPRRATLIVRHDGPGGSTAVELVGEGAE